MISNNFIQAKETNEDWNNCLDENSLVMGRCVYACNGDRNCMSDCNDDFLERQLDCPCEVGINDTVSFQKEGLDSFDMNHIFLGKLYRWLSMSELFLH